MRATRKIVSESKMAQYGAINIPSLGMFEYSDNAKFFFAFHTHATLGTILLTLHTDDKIEVEKQAVCIERILNSSELLDSCAKSMLASKAKINSQRLKGFTLASIDCYVNGEFDFFYDSIDEILEWVTISFDKNLSPICAVFD